MVGKRIASNLTCTTYPLFVLNTLFTGAHSGKLKRRETNARGAICDKPCELQMLLPIMEISTEMQSGYV
jgi:hypothetical protein